MNGIVSTAANRIVITICFIVVAPFYFFSEAFKSCHFQSYLMTALHPASMVIELLLLNLGSDLVIQLGQFFPMVYFGIVSAI